MADFKIDTDHLFNSSDFYRRYKDEMVVGFTGDGDMFKREVPAWMICLFSIMNQCHYHCLMGCLRNASPWFDEVRKDVRKTRLRLWANTIFDVLLCPVPVILCAGYLDWVWVHHSICLGLIVFELFIYHFVLGFTKPVISSWIIGGNNPRRIYRVQNPPNTKDEKNGRSSLLVYFFDHKRAQTMTVICIAILAIDFPTIFARSSCKTEEFGISLMDTGVALVTLGSGISSNKARPWYFDQTKMSFMKEIMVTLPNLATTFVFGFARLFMVK